ncbi:MAG: hypothetical protein VX265_04715 [Myxococcota bacterium]|nr:hypothetical protein [Myxococcota bacterium]
MTRLLLPLLAFLGRTAHATRLQVETVACPVGGAPTKVYEKIVTNTLGGFDSDLAAYSDKGQYRQYAVSTCPDNLVSLYGPDMRTPMDAETQTRVLAAVEAIRPTLPPADALQVWDRYLLAGAAYRAMGASSIELADLYLRASWTARDKAVGVVRGLEGPIATRALLDDGRAELAKGLTNDQRRTVIFNLARIAHRGGYTAERDALLGMLRQTPGIQPRELQAAQTLSHYGGTVEPVLQDLAIAAYTEALRNPLEMTQKIRATYVLGDLLRRRGRERESLPLLTLVLAEEEAPPNLREMAGALHAELLASGAGAERPDPVR